MIVQTRVFTAIDLLLLKFLLSVVACTELADSGSEAINQILIQRALQTCACKPWITAISPDVREDCTEHVSLSSCKAPCTFALLAPWAEFKSAISVGSALPRRPL